MGDGADMALDNAFDDMEHYERFKYSDHRTQYDEGIIDERGAIIGNPGSFPARTYKRKSSGPGNCPICNKETVIRDGKFGKFRGCVDFPKCKGNRNI